MLRLESKTVPKNTLHFDKLSTSGRLRAGLGMKRAETCSESTEGLSASSTRLVLSLAKDWLVDEVLAVDGGKPMNT